MRLSLRMVGAILIVGLLIACGEESTPDAVLPDPEKTSTPTQTAEPIPELEQAQPPTPTEIPTPTDTAEPTATLPPSQGMVVELINEVVAHPLPQGEWETAALNMLLYAGGEVWSKDASTALVDLDVELLRVAPNTIFTLSQPDADTTVLNLQDGQAWINIEGLSPGESFEVETSTAVASVEGTRFSVRIDEADQTIVSSQVNTVTVATTEGSVSVGAGDQTNVLPGQAPTDPQPMSTEERLRWHMATGPELEIDIPLIGIPYTTMLEGETGEPGISSDGSHLTFYIYNPSIWTSSFSAFISLEATGSFTDSFDTARHQVSFNPAGDGMAYVTHEQGSQICTSAEDGSGVSCFGDQGDYYWPTWSPDGSQLVYEDSNTLMVSRPDGSDAIPINTSESGLNIRATWSADGTKIAYVNTPSFKALGDVWVVNTDGSNPQQIFTGIQWSYFEKLAWSPDGEWFALPADDGIWLVSADGSSSQQIPGTGAWQYHDVTWSPTSTGWPLFFGYEDKSTGEAGTMYITRLGSDPKPFPNATWGPVWSGDGRWGAFGYVAKVNGAYQSTIYMLEIEPAFWP